MSEDRMSTMKEENSTLSKSDPSKIPCLTDKKAIEWYLKYDEDKFIQFEQIERTSTIYKCDPHFDQLAEFRVIEPLGMLP